MLSWKYRIFFAAGTLGLAMWLGYRSERHVMDSAGSKPVTIQSVVRRVMAPKSRTGQIDRLNRIRHDAGRTPPSRREITASWEIIRGFAIDDVKAYLEEIPSKPHRPANDALISMLFFRWAQLDPETAALEATKPPYDERDSAILSVATAWTDRDPDGALRWSSANGSPRLKNMIGISAGRMLALRDPREALTKASNEYPDAMSGVVVTLARKSGDTEETRRMILSELSALSNPRPLNLYLNQLLRSAYHEDEETARSLIDQVEQSGIPEEEITHFRNALLSQFRRERPREILEEMQKPEAQTSAHQQVLHYFGWVATNPEEATAWAVESGRADLISEVVKHDSWTLLRSNWQPGSAEPPNRLDAVLGSQYASWKKIDASGAEAWLKTMPADLRHHLSKDHATR